MEKNSNASRKIVVFFVLCSLLFVSFFIWQGIFTPKDVNSSEEKLFSIEKGQGLFQIAENLEKQSLIKSRFLFDFYVISKKKQSNLQAGQYLLSSSMNIPQVAQKIIFGDTVKIKITIPEGFTVKQIEERLNLKLPEDKLEGFLFPDTYQFPIEVSGEEAVRIMKDNFDKKLTSELREEIEKQNKTIFEIIVIASMIEKEVKTVEDKKLVSGILWKRLESKMPLQIDATITYITGKKTTKISLEELKIDSPYNTYKYLGLPVGPICNPGLDSILAAIYPKDSGYWYYLSASAAKGGEPRLNGRDGETIFSKTLEEHRINKEKYL